MHGSNFLIKIFHSACNLIFHKLTASWKMNCRLQLLRQKTMSGRDVSVTLFKYHFSFTFTSRNTNMNFTAMSSAKKKLQRQITSFLFPCSFQAYCEGASISELLHEIMQCILIRLYVQSVHGL